MLMIMSRLRTMISPILASAFALSLLVAPAGMTEVGVVDGVVAAEQHEADGSEHHHHGSDDRAPPGSGDHHGGHNCAVCLCFATPSGCSVATLSVVAAVAVHMPVKRTIGFGPAAHLPRAQSSFDIFHPPRL